jgi:hypothetical protein
MFDFQADQNTFSERIYEGTDRCTFHFDPKKGLVVRGEVEWTSGQLRGKGTGTLELKSVEELGPARLASLRDEMDRSAFGGTPRGTQRAGDSHADPGR